MKKEQFEDMLLKSANQAMTMQKLMDQVDMLKEVVEIYADPQHEYTVKYTRIIADQKVSFTKSFVEYSELAQSVLEKLNKM